MANPVPLQVPYDPSPLSTSAFPGDLATVLTSWLLARDGIQGGEEQAAGQRGVGWAVWGWRVEQSVCLVQGGRQ